MSVVPLLFLLCFLLQLDRLSGFCCPAMASVVEDTMHQEVLDRQPDASSASSSNADGRQPGPPEQPGTDQSTQVSGPQSESDFRCGICKKSYSRRTRRRMWMWP